MNLNGRIESIGRDELKLIMDRAYQALESELADRGLTLKVTNGRYSGLSEGSFRVEVMAVADGEPVWKATKEWEALRVAVSFDPALLGSVQPGELCEVWVGGKSMKGRCIGWKNRALKRPVMFLEEGTEKVFVMPLGMVQDAKSVEEEA